MHFTRFSHRRNATYNLNRLNRVNALCFVDLNNTETGKRATKPRALGLLGHSGFCIYQDCNLQFSMKMCT